jgi:hypothetical protein
MCGHMIAADTQNLGVQFLKPAVLAPERNCLLSSTTGKIKDVKGKDDMLLAMELAEADIPIHRGESKIRSAIPHFCWHETSLVSNRVVCRARTLLHRCLRYDLSRQQYSIPSIVEMGCLVQTGANLLPVYRP